MQLQQVSLSTQVLSIFNDFFPQLFAADDKTIVFIIHHISEDLKILSTFSNSPKCKDVERIIGSDLLRLMLEIHFIPS